MEQKYMDRASCQRVLVRVRFREGLLIIGLTLAAIGLGAAAAFGQGLRHKALSHATDCTARTGGQANQFCYELDDNAWYVCEPTSGDCDTAGEWEKTSGERD